MLAYSAAKADFAQHYNLAQQYLMQYQYSSAIIEFKKALRINYMDNSARVGLINSYLARGTYFANNDKNFLSAANDYRAALFYLKYYPEQQDIQNSANAIANAAENLSQCFGVIKFDTTAKSRFQTAQDLRLQGLFPEAGYEFAQAAADASYRKKSYEQIADIMKILGNDSKCSEYYQKAIAIVQDDPILRLKYARILDKLGNSDDAVKEYNFALVNGGDDPEILYALERIYRQKLAQSPNDAPTITNLGAILQKQNKFDEALQYYTQASQIDGSNVTTRLNLGTLYQQRKSYDAAIAAYDSILLLYPDNVDATLYKAQCLAALGQKDEAKAAFKRVLGLDPTNKIAKNQMFDLIKSSMTPAEMISYMNQNSQNGVNEVYNYAIELHKQNKFDDAIAYYKEILKIKTDNPEIYLNLAIAYKQKNDIPQAIQTLEAAKIKFPENKQILNNLSEIKTEIADKKFDEASKFYNSGEYQKALEIYLSIQPQTFDSLTGAAICYKGLNDDNQAIEYYKKALSLKPDSDIAYYIGVLYSEKENWATSREFLKKAISINPNNTKAKDLLQSVIEQANAKLIDEAIALYDKSEYAKALPVFNKVLQDDPRNAYAYYYKGLMNDSGKKYLAAIDDYKKAIQYNKDLTIIYYLLALDYDALSQYKNALINYKKYIALTTESNEYKTYSQTRAKELKKYEN